MLIVLAGLLLGACTSAARSDEDFRRQAVQSLEQTLSAVRTAWYAAELAGQGQAFGAYLAVLTADAQQTGQSEYETFAAVTPPTEQARQLGAEVAAELREATAALTAADEAAEQAGPAALADQRQALDDLGRRLADLLGRLG